MAQGETAQTPISGRMDTMERTLLSQTKQAPTQAPTCVNPENRVLGHRPHAERFYSREKSETGSSADVGGRLPEAGTGVAITANEQEVSFRGDGRALRAIAVTSARCCESYASSGRLVGKLYFRKGTLHIPGC